MNFKKAIPTALAVLVFIIASLIYFNPVLSGKQIKQSDITQFMGMSKEIVDFRNENNEEPYWTGTAFSGMPAYQLSAYYPNDFISYVDKLLRFLPRPADYLFLYFFGFFVLLSVLKVDWKLAILGALSFGFSTYLIIIFGAGHNAKAHAIAYMPLVVSGVLLIFKKRFLLGFVVTALAMALEVYANHPQMTYYLGFSIFFLVVFELMKAVKKKQLPNFLKQAVVLVFAVLLGIGVNSSRLLAMKEYTTYSTRGKSELTINPDGSKKEISSGLDKSYITEYSYGILETFNLMIPNFMGGGTVQKLGSDSNFYQVLKDKAGVQQAKAYSERVPTYWGRQPYVEAPAYVGVIIVFFFVLGLFLVKGRLKYWLVASVIFSIIMSWGKNFEPLTNFFIDYVPLYNKFRAVSSIQVIAELCIPLLGFLGLKKLFSTKITSTKKEEALKKSFFIVGGLTLFFTLFGSSFFAFEGINDVQFQQLPELVEALISDRKSLFFKDSLRSFLLVLAAATTLWFWLKNKLTRLPVLFILAGLILFDLVSVAVKYVNKDDFTVARKVQKPFTPSQVDKEILKDKSNYRVANFSGNPMNEGRTSYFHKSIGGYHAAKMKRYQELFDHHIAKNNIEVLNMLNTKYIIFSDTEVRQNTDANGSAWFVNTFKGVNNADDEIKALKGLNTKTTVVYNKKELQQQNITLPNELDSTATIKLTKYNVNELIYKSNSQKDQVAVFSEIYYKDGWKAYVDGKFTPHFRVNYVLRAMVIPSGNHTVEFKFEPTVIHTGSTISLISYALILVISLGWFFSEKRKNG